MKTTTLATLALLALAGAPLATAGHVTSIPDQLCDEAADHQNIFRCYFGLPAEPHPDPWPVVGLVVGLVVDAANAVRDEAGGAVDDVCDELADHQNVFRCHGPSLP
ncbi:MAG TPA: hypothetical protein VHH36_06470 [Candidatus Thermoplasmatota archaeon]|nr:hypothetical protein [Candidatus Thermoplasmatota archaeon]